MNHILNVVIAAATVGAMASAEKIDIDSIDISGAEDGKLNEAYALVKSPIVKNVIDANFAKLVSVIHKEEKSLVEIYASVQTGGDSDILLKSFSNGFQSSNQTGQTINSSNSAGASCHSNCHGNCHGNHSSRGWR